MNRVARFVDSAGLSGNDWLSTGKATFVCRANCGTLRRTNGGNWAKSPSCARHVGGFFVRSFWNASLCNESIRDLGMNEVDVEVQALVGGPGGVISANMIAMVP